MCWNTRIFSASSGNNLKVNSKDVFFQDSLDYFGKNLIGGGAFCNGQKIHASETDQVNGSLHTFLLFAIVVGFLQPIVFEIHRQEDVV